ncbi:hypothetical protein ACFL54_01440 [Planctomycetota bacterium]
MINLVKLALKNIREHRVATSLTVIGVAVAIFIFCFFQAIQFSMTGIITEAGRYNNLVIAEEGKW